MCQFFPVLVAWETFLQLAHWTQYPTRREAFPKCKGMFQKSPSVYMDQVNRISPMNHPPTTKRPSSSNIKSTASSTYDPSSHSQISLFFPLSANPSAQNRTHPENQKTHFHHPSRDPLPNLPLHLPQRRSLRAHPSLAPLLAQHGQTPRSGGPRLPASSHLNLRYRSYGTAGLDRLSIRYPSQQHR